MGFQNVQPQHFLLGGAGVCSGGGASAGPMPRDGCDHLLIVVKVGMTCLIRVLRSRWSWDMGHCGQWAEVTPGITSRVEPWQTPNPPSTLSPLLPADVHHRHIK